MYSRATEAEIVSASATRTDQLCWASFDLVCATSYTQTCRSGSGAHRGRSAGQKRCCMLTCFIWDKRVVGRRWRKSLPSCRAPFADRPLPNLLTRLFAATKQAGDRANSQSCWRRTYQILALRKAYILGRMSGELHFVVAMLRVVDNLDQMSGHPCSDDT